MTGPRTPTNFVKSRYKLNWLSIETAAEILELNKQQVHHLVRTGRIPAQRLDGHLTPSKTTQVPLVIHRVELQEFIDNNPHIIGVPDLRLRNGKSQQTKK